MSRTARHPLRWPDGIPRTHSPFRGPFDRDYTLSAAYKALEAEIKRLPGVDNVDVTCGLSKYVDKGACAWFTVEGEQYAVSSDLWDEVTR